MENKFLTSLKTNLTNFVDWLKDTNTNIDEFEILDTSIEDWKEISSKTFKFLGGISKIYNISQQIIFKRFLKGIASKINNTNSIDSNSKQKLENFLSKSKNIEFVYTTIRKSLTANSLKCTELLAIIVGEILLKQLEMSPENITIIDALHNLNDYDLNNFYKIYTNLCTKQSSKERLDILCKEIDCNIKLSLNKLVSEQLLVLEYAKLGINNSPVGTVYGNIIQDNEKYILLNNISEILFNLLEKTKNQILLDS